MTSVKLEPNLVLLLLALTQVSSYAKPNSRIINGDLIDEAIPYVVSIQSFDSHICGGFIYNEKWIITAASCVENKLLSSLKVSINDYRFINNNDPGEFKVPVYRLVINQGYNSTTKENDIALVELAETLTLEPISTNNSPTPSPSCIRYDEVTGLTPGSVPGWGLLEPNGANITTLHVGNMAVTSSLDCAEVASFTSATMICTKSLPSLSTGKRSAPCTYDEGSPFVVVPDTGTNEQIVVGIFSFNNDCDATMPSIFTRLSVFYAWIGQIAGYQPANCY